MPKLPQGNSGYSVRPYRNTNVAPAASSVHSRDAAYSAISAADFIDSSFLCHISHTRLDNE